MWMKRNIIWDHSLNLGLRQSFRQSLRESLSLSLIFSACKMTRRLEQLSAWKPQRISFHGWRELEVRRSQAEEYKKDKGVWKQDSFSPFSFSFLSFLYLPSLLLSLFYLFSSLKMVLFKDMEALPRPLEQKSMQKEIAHLSSSSFCQFLGILNLIIF